MADEDRMTTANVLGAFREGLIRANITDPNLLDHLVRDAANHLLEYGGLQVRRDEVAALEGAA